MRKERLKKLVASVLTLAMALSTGSVFAMITPPEETGIIKADDFEGSSLTVKFGTQETLEDGNKVAAASTAQGAWKETAINAKTDAPQDIVISFDAMAGQTTGDSFQMFVRRTTDDADHYRGYCDFAGIEFSDDGTIRRNANGAGALNSVYSNAIGTYEANKWYSIDMVIRGVSSTTYNTTVEYYIDGVLVDTLDSSAFKDMTHPTSGLHYQSDATITGVFVGSDDTSESGKMYYDNAKIYKLGADSEYYAYADTDNAANGKISIEYSEAPLATETAAVIKALDGTQTAVTLTRHGRYAIADFDATALAKGVEYSLVLPTVNSVTGKALANNVIPFVIPAEASVDAIYVAEYDFDTWTDSATGLNGIKAGYGGTLQLIPSELVADKSGTGNALQFAYIGKGYTESTHLTGFKNGDSSAYQWGKVAGLSEFIAELDIKAPELGQVTTNNVVYAGGKKAATYIIDKNGYFTASTNLNANNNTTIQWDGVVAADGTYKTGFSEATHKVVKTTPGEWYNVKVGITPATGTVRYYVDDVLLTEYINPAITATSQVTELRICSNDFADDSVTSYTVIDNVKFGWALGDLKLENTAGTMVQAKNTQAANNGWGLRNVRVELISNANAESSEFANSAAIISADITLDTVANNLMPTIYSPNGNVLASFQILNANGDVYIQPEAPNVIGKDTDGDGKYTFETGTATVEGAFKPGVATNVTAYVDAARTYVYLFLDGLFVKKLETQYLQGVTAKVFDCDGDKTIEPFEILPARIGVRMLEGTDNAGNIAINNAKLFSADKEAVIESIRLKSADDEYSIYNANISNQLTEIEINYSSNVAATPVVTLTNSEGSAVSTGTVAASENVVTLPVTATYLPNDTYTITVDTDTYSFVVDCDMALTIKKFDVVDDNGDPIDYMMSGTCYYADVEILNSTATEAPVVVIVATYENDKLADVDFVETSIGVGETFTIDETTADDLNAALTAGMDTTEVQVFLWSSFSSAAPYAEAISITK